MSDVKDLLDKYPKWLDDYLREKKCVIELPKYLRDIEIIPDITIKTARQLYEHILTERDFWQQYATKNNCMIYRIPPPPPRPLTSSYNIKKEPGYPRNLDYLGVFNTAYEKFQEILNKNFNTVREDLISDMILALENCQINSKTRLAKDFFVKFKDENREFFEGFKNVVENQENKISQNSGFYKGLYYGLEYRNTRKEQFNLVGNLKEEFKEAANNATKGIGDFMSSLESKYNEQDKEISNLRNKHIEKLEEMKKGADDFINENKEVFEKIQKDYKEKLSLEEPAKDWEEIEQKYEKAATKWIITSLVIGAIVVVVISLLIIFLPQIDKNTDIFNIVRVTLLLAVITSVSIYLLRITIKLALSNFHLSKDATERQRLTRFYMSMKKHNLIEASERALIVASLFSRSDTGLLKENSTPEMPTLGNIMEIAVGKKQ